MNKLISFTKTALIGGLGVLLPLTLIFLILRWLYDTMTKVLAPIAYFLRIENQLVANILALIIVLLSCFAIGLFVKTKFGGKIYFFLEKTFFVKIPGYKISKNFSEKLTGGASTIYSQAVIVRLSENESKIGFMAEQNNNGTSTVFIPSIPDIVSGEVIIVSNEQLSKIEAPAQEVINSLVSYGTNSQHWMK